MSIETQQDHLQAVLDRLADLSPEQLLTVQEAVERELQHKQNLITSRPKILTPIVADIVLPPGIYRLTPEEAKLGLEEVFDADELAEMEQTDVSNLPPLPVSITQIIREGRDRY